MGLSILLVNRLEAGLAICFASISAGQYVCRPVGHAVRPGRTRGSAGKQTVQNKCFDLNLIKVLLQLLFVKKPKCQINEKK